MNLLTIIAVITAIGTIILASITRENVKSLHIQEKIMQRQVLLQRASVYPFLELIKTPIIHNTIALLLENKGKGPAFRIGMLIRFLPLEYTDNDF